VILKLVTDMPLIDSTKAEMFRRALSPLHPIQDRHGRSRLLGNKLGLASFDESEVPIIYTDLELHVIGSIEWLYSFNCQILAAQSYDYLDYHNIRVRRESYVTMR
jgi:hypothetical protein